MKSLIFLAVPVLCASSIFAQEAVVPYEAAPTLRAADILKPEILSGANHRVLDKVSTALGRNHYIIETPWGFLSAEGDSMLMARVAEARAIAELENVSRSDEFKNGLKNAARTPLNVARGLVESPSDTIKGSAKGVWKFVNRAGESAKNLTEGRKRGQGEDNAAKQLLGFSKIKRKIALQLGTDPYSSNELFQQQLESVAWTSTAGEATFAIATLPIGGGIGIALTATKWSQSFQDAIRDLSPSDLRLANKKLLLGMDVTAREADAFLANTAFSPTNQTAFVHALASMTGVKNRKAFVALAGEISTEEADALFCSGTAQLLAALHAGNDKLERIATLGDFPVAILADGRLVVALQWDTAFWSERADQFITAAQSAKLGQTGVVVALTGNATPCTKEELQKRKIGLLTLALDGAQK